MKDKISHTPEEARAMGYDPDVVEFFRQKDPDLLKFMWGNGSGYYNSILKNEINNSNLIQTARAQIEVQGRVGGLATSSLIMAEYRLTHPQNLVSSEKK